MNIHHHLPRVQDVVIASLWPRMHVWETEVQSIGRTKAGGGRNLEGNDMFNVGTEYFMDFWNEERNYTTISS